VDREGCLARQLRSGDPNDIPRNHPIAGMAPRFHSVRHARSREIELAEHQISCHYTAADLVCTSEKAAVLIIREYREKHNPIFRRGNKLAANTILIDWGIGMDLLSIHGTQAVIANVSIT